MTRPGGDEPADSVTGSDAPEASWPPAESASSPSGPAAAETAAAGPAPGDSVLGESVLGETAPCGCPWESGLSTYLDGWLAGQAFGYEQGHADGLDAITPAAEALAELRSTLGPSHEELQRIRNQARGPARTSAQIRAETSYSWRRFERQLAARHTERAGQAGHAAASQEADQAGVDDHGREHGQGRGQERDGDGDDLGAGHPTRSGRARVGALVGAGGGERAWVG